jgi:hypothetical protein
MKFNNKNVLFTFVGFQLSTLYSKLQCIDIDIEREIINIVQLSWFNSGCFLFAE